MTNTCSFLMLLLAVVVCFSQGLPVVNNSSQPQKLPQDNITVLTDDRPDLSQFLMEVNTYDQVLKYCQFNTKTDENYIPSSRVEAKCKTNLDSNGCRCQLVHLYVFRLKKVNETHYDEDIEAAAVTCRLDCTRGKPSAPLPEVR